MHSSKEKVKRLYQAVKMHANVLDCFLLDTDSVLTTSWQPFDPGIIWIQCVFISAQFMTLSGWKVQKFNKNSEG